MRTPILNHSVAAVCAAAMVVLSCTGEGPIESLDSPDFSLRGTEPTPNADHIVLFGAAGPRDFAERVAALGGSVVRTHPEIGVGVVTGLTDAAANRLLRSPGIVDIARDVIVQWTPRLEELPVSIPRAAGENIGILDAEHDGVTQQSHDPTDATFWDNQWNMRIIDADDAWAAGFQGDPNVRVAILDSGLDPDHQDLAGLIDESSSTAFIPSQSGPPDWADDGFHGSHVGGTVVSNGLGTAGVATHVTLMAVKVLDMNGTGPFSAIIAGILHASNAGADVINMSLSATFPRSIPGIGTLVGAVNQAVNFAHNRGALVVSAAGNAAMDLDHNFNLLTAPCESGSGMCISATGPTDELASYSNFGASQINVAGPGGDFVVTGEPETSTIMAPCSSRTALAPLQICTTDNDWYLFLEGTSMAAPHVAGAAAMLDAQSGGALNAAQLRTALQASADDLGPVGTDPAFGKGRINVCALLRC